MTEENKTCQWCEAPEKTSIGSKDGTVFRVCDCHYDDAIDEANTKHGGVTSIWSYSPIETLSFIHEIRMELRERTEEHEVCVRAMKRIIEGMCPDCIRERGEPCTDVEKEAYRYHDQWSNWRCPTATLRANLMVGIPSDPTGSED